MTNKNMQLVKTAEHVCSQESHLSEWKWLSPNRCAAEVQHSFTNWICACMAGPQMTPNGRSVTEWHSYVKFTLYLKKAGLTSRNIVHLRKKHSTLCRFLPLYSSLHLWSRLDHYIDSTYTPAGSSFRFLADTLNTQMTLWTGCCF